jgi:hypothetical protein
MGASSQPQEEEEEVKIEEVETPVQEKKVKRGRKPKREE